RCCDDHTWNSKGLQATDPYAGRRSLTHQTCKQRAESSCFIGSSGRIVQEEVIYAIKAELRRSSAFLPVLNAEAVADSETIRPELSRSRSRGARRVRSRPAARRSRSTFRRRTRHCGVRPPFRS